MKLNLATRLFAAVLLTAVAVAAAMGVSAHVNLNRDFLGYLNEQAKNRLDLAVPSVTDGYRQHGSWDFLRERPGLWYRLLRPLPGDDTRVPVADRPPTPATPAELTGASRRFTLLDENRQRIVGFATGLAALLAAGAVAFWVSRRLLRPVQRVAEASQKLAGGDYSVRVPQTEAQDEIGQLGRHFNHLALTLQRNECMRREFMADVSHELRTPLSVLNGELEALQDGVRRLEPASLRALQGEVATLHKLVDDLYELSLADVGALSYRKSPLDLREVIGDAAEAFTERLQSQGLALKVELPAEPLSTFGDERRLRQLFANLLENCCRYTDAGGSVQMSARRAGRHTLVEVHDSAPGVPADLVPRLFERFFRVEPSRSRASGGAGLGLSICQRIVEAHEGPDPLPLDPGPARVLVVEDEPRLASLLADYLRAAGHHPECVSDGAAALTAWRERQHDLVLLDLMLPGVDGLSVCRQLRAVSRVPIVMLTARADERVGSAGRRGDPWQATASPQQARPWSSRKTPGARAGSTSPSTSRPSSSACSRRCRPSPTACSPARSCWTCCTTMVAS